MHFEDCTSCPRSLARFRYLKHRLCKPKTSRRRITWPKCRDRHVSVIAANAPTNVEPLRFGVGSVQEIPIFPLSVVAFPTAQVPLNIFEARYRVLFNTLLAGSSGIVEDLVSAEKPWAGTRLFGMCYANREGKMAHIGTTLHIQRSTCKGSASLNLLDRYLTMTEPPITKSLLPLEKKRWVEILEDDEDESEATALLAKESMDIFRSFVQLNIKLNNLKGSGATIAAVDEMTPRQTSYWLAAIFAQNAYAQQALLEETTVKARLASEKEVLESITKMLRAQLAVQSAFEPQEEGIESGSKLDADHQDNPSTGEAEDKKQ